MINQEKKYMNIDPELIIGTVEAARMLGVSDRAVRGLIHRGTLPAARYGGSYYLHRGAVEFFKEFRNCHKSGSASVAWPGKCIVNEQKRTDLCSVSSVQQNESLRFNDWPPVYPPEFVNLWQQSNENSCYGIKFKRQNKHYLSPEFP